MNDAQRKYKANIKRRYVEFDMRKDDERAMYHRAGLVNFSAFVKSFLAAPKYYEGDNGEND